MRVIREEGLLARVTELGAHLANGLKDLISKFEGLAVAVRGRGLVQGLELATAEDAKRALAAATDKGLLLNAVQGKTLRFVPALVASKAELDEALDLTAASLAALAGS
jgi:acetylornithine/succinyldiaminopimelate/putrescine aminotransferase